MRLKAETEEKQVHWISDVEIQAKLAQATRLENIAILQKRSLNFLKKNKALIHPNPENIERVERVLARLDELEELMYKIEKELEI